MIKLKVNGQEHELTVDPETPLLWALRDHLGLMGVKYSCGVGECGACTVHLNGEAVRSCTISLAQAAGGRVTTIEGLEGPVAKALKQAWLDEEVPQCGYCQPGQLIQAAELLARHPQPSDQQIDQAMSGVLCRCGTYQHIRKAIHRAAKEV